MNQNKKAFTLVELLVVIAIIGILSSVVLANLNGARQKARDTKRVADIKQLQLSLELYVDANAKYPGVLSDLAPTYISVVPTPPGGTTQTSYAYIPLNSGCNSYHLGAILEAANSALSSDTDAAAGTVASPAATACDVTGVNTAVTATADFNGTSLACTTTAGADQCFDVTP